MKTILQAIGGLAAIVVAIVFLMALTVGTSFFGLNMKRYFAPKHEQIRYDVHKESQSYRDGMVRRLRNLQLEYQKASPEHRDVIASTIRHESADVPREYLPYDLATFIDSL